MTDKPCQTLDDYLAGELSATERAAFEAHQAGCPACDVEIKGQRRLEALLRQATSSAEFPTGLIDRCLDSIRVARRRRIARWLGGLSAAAAVVLAVGFWPKQIPPARQVVVLEDQGTMPEASRANEVTRPAIETKVTIDPRSGFLAVPQANEHPNVTIYWLYPTLNTAAADEPAGAPESPRSEI
jgi:anti-sigma factor RsiW